MNYQQAINAVTEPPKNYYDDILDWAVKWCQQYRAQEFTSEQMRSIYELFYADKFPAEPRVYGAVFRQLEKAGLIEKAGFASSTNPKAHHRPINVWRVK